MAANKLPALMRELGYSCTASESSFLKLLSQVPRIDESAAAEVLAVMATTLKGLDDNLGLHNTLSNALDGGFLGEPGSTTWNFNSVVDAFKRSNPQLDWSKVADALDTPSFLVPDQQAFLLLTAAFKRGSGSQLPVKAVVGRLWANAMGQASFLKFAVNAPPETFSFQQSEHKIEPLEGLHGGKNPLGSPNQAWASIDLLSVLCKLDQGPAQQVVRQVVDVPLKMCPEVLLAAMAAVQPEGQQWPALQREVMLMLTPVYLANNPNSIPVMQRLWNINRNFVTRSMVDWYQQDTTHISRILDVCQDIKALSTILDNTPFPFAMEMAALAHRREYLNLDKWLSERLMQGHVGFLQAMVDFVDQKTQVVDGQPVASLPGRVSVSIESLAIFLRSFVACRSANPPMASELVSELNRVQAQAIRAFPQLQLLVQGPSTPLYASDIEEEANTTFQKLYGDALSLEEVIAKLRRSKTSNVPREQEVFACMIHNLFDEYKFFPRYPPKELRITAILFGQLVHHQLVSSITLGIALRYVVEALAKAPSDNMFKFGMEALTQFRSQIGAWPAFCNQLLQIPHMRDTDPELYAMMEKVASGQQGGVDASAALQQGMGQPKPGGMLGLAGTEEGPGMTNGVGEGGAGDAFGLPGLGGLRPGFGAAGGCGIDWWLLCCGWLDDDAGALLLCMTAALVMMVLRAGCCCHPSCCVQQQQQQWAGHMLTGATALLYSLCWAACCH
jgi:CCR4-NOT transcription complex subunit 1